jgi:hypothetical protein
MITGKHCIECKRWFPLFMFKTDIRKYTIAEAKKKVRRCRLCVDKESRNGKVVRWREGDFRLVTLTLKQRLKEFFAK